MEGVCDSTVPESLESLSWPSGWIGMYRLLMFRLEDMQARHDVLDNDVMLCSRSEAWAMWPPKLR